MSLGGVERPSLEPQRTENGASSLMPVPSGSAHATWSVDLPGGTESSAASSFSRAGGVAACARMDVPGGGDADGAAAEELS